MAVVLSGPASLPKPKKNWGSLYPYNVHTPQKAMEDTYKTCGQKVTLSFISDVLEIALR